MNVETEIAQHLRETICVSRCVCVCVFILIFCVVEQKKCILFIQSARARTHIWHITFYPQIYANAYACMPLYRK